ncbi:MAG: sigma-54-dependent Fis family transcriptional regulator [Acidobacteria bacterium]|nr:MAG: sigma-54-dependent Fis family transcriptional regulator [Acidobacteriota bacterium]PYY22953.1 MAG: sigma-54-dependent Fis family transcriptional regulator [Acidobacteriota bacterium]
MSANATILIVDDEPSMLRYTKTLLEVDNYSVETAGSGFEAIKRVQEGLNPSLILLDMAMPSMNGLQTIEECKKIRPEQKIVVLSCVSDTSTVVQAIKLGALDYVTKPFYKSELDAVLKRCLEPEKPAKVAADIQRYSVSDDVQIESLEDDLFFLAASPQMKQIRAQVSLVAKVDVPVLLLGESGVGKEILARLIHKMSIRAHRPLLKVNCAALPAELLESELFGYEAGAFTGAQRSKPGKFEQCNKGTILLDEIGEMTTALQAKLLHVLQDGSFSRLGSRSNVTVDVRVLAATNINIEEAIANKTLREDLYYRLNAFTMHIPPLRERREEIPLLLKHFMNRLSERYANAPLSYSERLVRACMLYHWPGNLRELGNFVKRYLVLQDEEMAISELEAKGKGQGNGSAEASLNGGIVAAPEGGLKSLVRSLKDEAELRAIEQALLATNWNRKLAAARLNISYKALLYKIKQYQIVPPGSSRLSEPRTGLR